MADNDQSDLIIRGAGSDLPDSPEHERRLLAALPDDAFVHDQYLIDLAPLNTIERGGAPERADEHPNKLRVAAWNLARGIRPAAACSGAIGASPSRRR